MDSDLQDFEQFMNERAAAAQAYVNGNVEPLARISTHDLPATFFSPAGDYELGTKLVSSRYKKDAQNFVSGETTFEILQMGASGELAYWTGFQRASVHLKGNAEVLSMNLRVTELFRLEIQGWKLIHRHADFQKDASGH